MGAESDIYDVAGYRNGRPATEFPGASFPVVFADSASSFTPTTQVVKVYFSRIDPNMHGLGGVEINPILQMIMPTSGFVAMAVFFEQQLDRMVGQGLVTRAQVNEAKAQLGIPATPPKEPSATMEGGDEQ